MAQDRITNEAMDTEEEAGAVSTLGSLASGGDTPVYFLAGNIHRPGSPFVGLGPIRRNSRRVQMGQSGTSGGPSRQPSSSLELSRLAACIGTVMGQFD